MKLLIDLDSTVADLMTDWLGAINADWQERAGFAYMLPMVKTWDVGAHHPAGKSVFDYLARPGMFRNLRPFPNAVETLRKSYEARDTHYIVTDAVSSAAAQCETEKILWCAQWLPWIPLENICVVHKGDAMNKTALCAKLKPDIVIEDGPHHIASIRQMIDGAQDLGSDYSPSIMTIGYEYNRHVSSLVGVYISPEEHEYDFGKAWVCFGEEIEIERQRESK